MTEDGLRLTLLSSPDRSFVSLLYPDLPLENCREDRLSAQYQLESCLVFPGRGLVTLNAFSFKLDPNESDDYEIGFLPYRLRADILNSNPNSNSEECLDDKNVRHRNRATLIAGSIRHLMGGGITKGYRPSSMTNELYVKMDTLLRVSNHLLSSPETYRRNYGLNLPPKLSGKIKIADGRASAFQKDKLRPPQPPCAPNGTPHASGHSFDDSGVIAEAMSMRPE